MKRFLLLPFLLTACAGSAQDRRPNATTQPLTVIATTDFHGALEAEAFTLSDGTALEIGGAPLYAAYVKALRAKAKGPVIWVDGGDLFQGSMASNLYEGKPVVKIFNELELDATALGNHEFDYGPLGPGSVPQSAGDDARGALKARIGEARFPFLAANVFTAEGKIPDWLKPSVVLESKGMRIGVIGVASVGTPATTNALNLKGLVFEDPFAPVTAEAQRLRRDEKVDAIVVVGHIGAICTDNNLSRQDDLSSCQMADAELFELARKLSPGLVNVIVGGHTHRGVAKRLNGIALVQPFANGKYVSWVTVPRDSRLPAEVAGLQAVCGRWVTANGQNTCDPMALKGATGPAKPASFLGERVEPDQKTADLLRPYLEEVRARKDTSLGVSSAGEFGRSFGAESALGNFLADLTQRTIPGADLGLINGGGLRANLPAGTLTYGHIFKILPFDNQLALMKVSGATLRKLVAIGLSGKNEFYSWSSNLRAVADGCELKELTVNGKSVNPKATYTIATSDFLAGGGSGVSDAKVPAGDVKVFWDAPFVLREAIVGVLRQQKAELRADDFYDRKAPRQVIRGKCVAGAGGH